MRSYRLLCPIARALDRVGDRWALLVLRDLHAGPARFTDLRQGLVGIATNILTTRLEQLVEAGLVARREAEFGVSVYELTELGERTDELLYALGELGSRFSPDEEPHAPGNMRVLAVSLKVACRHVVDPELRLRAGLEVEGETLSLVVDRGTVDLRHGALDDLDVVIRTEYESLVAVGDGRMSPQDFATGHVEVVHGTADKAARLLDLLGRAMGTER